MRKPIDFVICGCPRSGTQYLSVLLNKISLHENLNLFCGYEHYFNPDQQIMDDDKDELFGDSSWLAVPFINKLPASTAIIQIIRNPLDVVNSLLNVGLFESWEEPNNRFTDFLKQYEMRCHLNSNHLSYLCYNLWMHWNGMIQEQCAKQNRLLMQLRLDKINPQNIELLLRFIGIKTNYNESLAERRLNLIRDSHKGLNRVPRKISLKWNDLPEFIKGQAKEYGF